MLPTSARLLRLLSLLQSRRAWTGHTLADELEVTPRTLRRDVNRLRSLGYPVNATSGVAGGYRLGAGASLPPLLLEDDEALAVSLGLRSAANGTVTGMEEAALRALAKLEQILPARLRRRVKALHHAVTPMPSIGPTIDADLLTALATAFRNQEVVSFTYRDAGGALTRRTVEPHGLVHAGPRWYLAAFDETRAAFRTFRVDRIDGRIKPSRRFVPRPIPHGSAAAYIARSLAADAHPHQASVVFDAPLDVIRGRLRPWSGTLTAVDSHRCRLETGAASLEHLATYLGLTGVDFEIEHPKELIDHVRALSARYARAAAGSRRRQRTATAKARIAPRNTR